MREILVLGGGNGASVGEVPNTSRAAAKWKENGAERICLEYSTAVAETGKNKLGFEIPATLPTGTTLAPKLTVERETNIAQIYTVSETLQLGHAALYRLCEARGNGDLKNGTYQEMFSKVFDQVKELIRVQVDVRHHKIVLARVEVVKQLKTINKDFGELQDTFTRELASAGCVPGAELQAKVKSIQPYPIHQSVSVLKEVEDLATKASATAPCIAHVKQAQETLVKLMSKSAELASKSSELDGIDSALEYLFVEIEPQKPLNPAEASRAPPK